jgi:hypothetical protein
VGAATLDRSSGIPCTDVLNPHWLAHDAQTWRSFPRPKRCAWVSISAPSRYASDTKNHVRLKLDKDMLKENPLVEVPARPLEAEIDD